MFACKRFLFSSPDLTTLKFQWQQDLQEDKMECYMYDIFVVSPTEMLVCDIDQQKVKLVNSTAGGVVASVSVPGGPRRICRLSDGIAAVSLATKKVQFIKLERDSLTLDGVLNVNRDILGITSLETCLVTSSFDPPCVEMISVGGKVMYTLDNQKVGLELFKRPNFLTSSRDSCIYVTDCGTKTVTKLDNKLNMMRTYTDPSLHGILDIESISRDQLLVCSADNHNIVLLNTRTANTTILLGEQDGLKVPYALTYCHTQRKLFIAPCDKTTHIQVYKLV